MSTHLGKESGETCRGNIMVGLSGTAISESEEKETKLSPRLGFRRRKTSRHRGCRDTRIDAMGGKMESYRLPSKKIGLNRVHCHIPQTPQSTSRERRMGGGTNITFRPRNSAEANERGKAITGRQFKSRRTRPRKSARIAKTVHKKGFDRFRRS